MLCRKKQSIFVGIKLYHPKQSVVNVLSQGLLDIPKTLYFKVFCRYCIIPTRQMEVHSKQSRLGDMISFGFI